VIVNNRTSKIETIKIGKSEKNNNHKKERTRYFPALHGKRASLRVLRHVRLVPNAEVDPQK
jgi:hypothetical protein